MCNIAGYSGNKQAAPILLEMLRRQQPYDGDMSTGIATIHEGKLHYRMIVGDVDKLIRETDVLDLPGTIGIAHTRPSGDPAQVPMHPNFNSDRSMAIVTNGTSPISHYCDKWDAAADRLEQWGYVFEKRFPNPKNNHIKLSSNGDRVCAPEVRVKLMEQYMKQGMSITKAMATACADIYCDNVSVVINQDYPDRIFALRTTRPMYALLENGEAYMATTRYGFAEELHNEPVMLPLHYACAVSKDGIHISADKMDIEPVMEMTPYTYAEAYKRFEALLKSDKAPVYFDDLEHAVGREMRDLWPDDHVYVQHARLVYDMLWQFDQEGRLKREMRLQDHPNGKRHRWYFWLED